MGSPSGSLRELYSEPPAAWSFVPISDRNGSSSSSIKGPVPDSGPSYQWSARPRPNSIYELSSDLNFEPSTPNAVALLRAAAASVILQYFSAAVENPWEVGKTLLQVQFVPRDAKAIEDLEPPEEEEEEASDDASSANEDNYFADETAESSSRVNTPRPVDDRGYIVRQSVSDSATRPDWIIPPGIISGVWDMMKQVIRWKPEGWLGLWKGTATFCVRTFLDSSLQPIIHSTLTHLFSTLTLSRSPGIFASSHPLLLTVSSNVATGFLLSPLDLIRTRLIVQTSHPRHRRYSGPLDALNHILMHEGGFRGLYLHPQLLYPTIMDTALTPLLSTLCPALAARFLRRLTGIRAEESHPLLWALTHLVGACASLLVTVPIEVIRRRLQIQTRGSAPPLPACVEVRRRPYAGMVDAFYSIITEERSDLPLRSRRHHAHKQTHTRRPSRAHDKGKGKEVAVIHEEEKEAERTSWLRNTGIGQLYRGLGMRAGASVIIFLATWMTADPDGNGWTEL
ncbi:hypothetical protein ACEPAF_3211 [Sanghuangporus sanghuang]